MRTFAGVTSPLRAKKATANPRLMPRSVGACPRLACSRPSIPPTIAAIRADAGGAGSYHDVLDSARMQAPTPPISAQLGIPGVSANPRCRRFESADQSPRVRQCCCHVLGAWRSRSILTTRNRIRLDDDAARICGTSKGAERGDPCAAGGRVAVVSAAMQSSRRLTCARDIAPLPTRSGCGTSIDTAAIAELHRCIAATWSYTQQHDRTTLAISSPLGRRGARSPASRRRDSSPRCRTAGRSIRSARAALAALEDRAPGWCRSASRAS